MQVAFLALVYTSVVFAQSEAKLTISGDIPAALTVTAADLASYPRDTIELSEEDGAKFKYEGVPLQEILKKAGIPMGSIRGKNLAAYILASAKDKAG